VEVHAGDDRREAVVRIPVDGGAPGAAVEVGAALVTAAGAGEHGRVRVRGEELAEELDEEVGQADVADGVGGLGRAEEQLAVDLVQGADVGVDVDVGVVEIGVGPVEPDQFAPAHAGVGGGDDQDLVDPAGGAGGDLGDLGRGGVGAFGAVPEGDLHAAGRVEADAPVFDLYRS
jgi:hypothetical protein